MHYTYSRPYTYTYMFVIHSGTRSGISLIIYYLSQKRRMIYKNLHDKGKTKPNGKRTLDVAVDAITVAATTAVVVYFFLSTHFPPNAHRVLSNAPNHLLLTTPQSLLTATTATNTLSASVRYTYFKCVSLYTCTRYIRVYGTKIIRLHSHIQGPTLMSYPALFGPKRSARRPWCVKYMWYTYIIIVYCKRKNLKNRFIGWRWRHKTDYNIKIQ